MESQTLLTAPPTGWPPARVAVAVADVGEVPWYFDGDRATTPLVGGGSLVASRDPLEATFTVPAPLDVDELVHPYLAGAAVFFARWSGFEVFHSGGVRIGDGVWAFLGDKMRGKSTLLAWLAARGLAVVTDDLLIVNRMSVFAGPRCIDLRPDAYERLPHELEAYRVRSGERQRLTLGPIEPELPLAGWIYLEWGDDLSWIGMSPTEKMHHIATYRGLKEAPTEPTTLLDLASLPAWRLVRPRHWANIELAVDSLIDRLS